MGADAHPGDDALPGDVWYLVLLHDVRQEAFDAVREVMRYWRNCDK